jgi:hypothetical protein
LVTTGAQVPAWYVGGVALTPPSVEPGATSTHTGGWSDDTGADASGFEHASSLDTVTIVEQESPTGSSHVHSQAWASSK